MAFTPRSISEIYDEMINEKNTKTYLTDLQPAIDDHQTFLDDLTSTSKVAIWRSMIWLVAFSIYLFEQVMLVHQNEVDAAIADSFVGSVEWYVAQAKLFQYGYSLIINSNYSVTYETIDTDAQICEFAAAEESAGTLVLKVRRKDTDIFSTDELNAFTEYMSKVKFAGTQIQIRNDYSDKLKLYMEIIYDPQYDLTTLKSNVETAINNYIENIEFNNKFYVNTLIDRIQSVDGVIDPQMNFSSSQVKTNTGSYSALTYIYKPFAGYLEIDSSFPLSTTITYTKNS